MAREGIRRKSHITVARMQRNPFVGRAHPELVERLPERPLILAHRKAERDAPPVQAHRRAAAQQVSERLAAVRDAICVIVNPAQLQPTLETKRLLIL